MADIANITATSFNDLVSKTETTVAIINEKDIQEELLIEFIEIHNNINNLIPTVSEYERYLLT